MAIPPAPQPPATDSVPHAAALPSATGAHAAEAAEAARLAALRDLDLLDTPESDSYDRITRMASRLFGCRSPRCR